MFSYLIKNASVIDGTGKPGIRMDVAIQGDRIAVMQPVIDAPAEKIIDAQGLVLTPGFIDVQNHSDSYWCLFDTPGLDSLITQGYTSLLVGNCGGSLAPLLSRDGLLSIQKWHELNGVNINWQSFSEYAAELSRLRFGCNVGSLVGYSTLRRGLVGDQVRSLDKSELEALKRELRTSIEAGAFGVSSGLSYAHEIIISELELYELVQIVSATDALFSVHLRSEGEEIIESLEEALEIARTTNARLKISHLKVRGVRNFGKFDELIERLENAYHRGVNVKFDVYPYDTIWQPLYSYLPKWAMSGGRGLMIRHFNDPIQRQKILSHLSNVDSRLSELIIASTANKLSVIGKKLGSIAKNLELSSEEALLELISNGGSEVLVFDKVLNASQVKALTHHPLAVIGTDGGGFAINNLETGGRGIEARGFQNKLIHPRCFGTAMQFLKDIVVEKSMPLEEAIRKLTLAPAELAGFKFRGRVAVDYYADIVLMDPSGVNAPSSYRNPYVYSEGVNAVFVNGKLAVYDGQVLPEKHGYFLRK